MFRSGAGGTRMFLDDLLLNHSQFATRDRTASWPWFTTFLPKLWKKYAIVHQETSLDHPWRSGFPNPFHWWGSCDFRAGKSNLDVVNKLLTILGTPEQLPVRDVIGGDFLHLKRDSAIADWVGGMLCKSLPFARPPPHKNPLWFPIRTVLMLIEAV